MNTIINFWDANSTFLIVALAVAILYHLHEIYTRPRS